MIYFEVVIGRMLSILFLRSVRENYAYIRYVKGKILRLIMKPLLLIMNIY